MQYEYKLKLIHIMKKVTNVVLVLCAVALLYMCFMSIMGPIDFEKEKAKRDRAVITRLIEIREAQLEYRKQYDHYTNDFDTLIDFIKNGRIRSLYKVGELTDLHREDGLTERKAMRIINKAKETDNWKEVEKLGLTEFKRDTIYIGVLDSLYSKKFNPDSIRYVPYTNGKHQFEMDIRADTLQSGPAKFFEVRTPYHVYLEGLDLQEIKNMTFVRRELNRYAGLKVGSLDEPLTTGNWESL